MVIRPPPWPLLGRQIRTLAPLSIFSLLGPLCGRGGSCVDAVYIVDGEPLSLSLTHPHFDAACDERGSNNEKKKTEGKKKRKSGTQTTTEIAVPTQQRLRQHLQVYISILLSENSNCPPDASIYVYAHLYLYLSQRMGVVCFPFLLYPCT